MPHPPTHSEAPVRKRRSRKLFLLGGVLAASTSILAIAVPAAWAEPPGALPASFEEADDKWQPSFDYDGDGCYPTPAISSDGALNPGLNIGGAENGDCHDESDLDNTNSYARSKCDGGWCAYMYGLYFEKDQAALGPGAAGHKHDWEHVVVWVKEDEDKAKYVSVSQHGGYQIKAADDLEWDGSHPKIIYHKDGISTHAFRFAKTGEKPENHKGEWQRPDLVSWDHYPEGIRDKLTGHDFGSAQFGLADSRFTDRLGKAKPEEVPFNPDA